MNTKNIANKAERKEKKRAARKKAAPKAKRPESVARGSNKRKTKTLAKGQRKR